MAWRKKYDSLTRGKFRAVLPGGSTVRGFIKSTDIGKLCIQSSNHGLLAVGTTADFGVSDGIMGIIAAVPENTTPGSTVPFYVDPILPGEIVEVDWSTAYAASTSLVIASTNIGRYLSWGNTTTPVSAGYLDPSRIGAAAGTTDALFFKLIGYSTQNNTASGTINSSHLAL